MSRAKFIGPLLVALGSMLWATDALFRLPLVQKQIDPTLLVFLDHLFVCFLMIPWMLIAKRKAFFKINFTQFIALILIGGGASGLATVFFTASFKYINPSVAILLQKLQPLVVVSLAALFLKERPKKPFFIWAPFALFAGIWLSFPQFKFDFVHGLDLQSKGSLLALSAAGLWALGTVVGRAVLIKLDPLVVTTWRFLFGLITLGLLLLVSGAPITIQDLRDPPVFSALVYMAFFPGLFAILIYYYGMARTPASTTTFLELLFPVSAVIINTVFLNIPLEPMQIAASVLLLFTVTQISRHNA